MIALQFGACSTYEDHVFGEDRECRVVVTVMAPLQSPPDRVRDEPIRMVLDTGAWWSVLDPSREEVLHSERLPPELDEQGQPRIKSLAIRNRIYQGHLSKVRLELFASRGSPLAMDATVFFPYLDDDEPWPHPEFLGLQAIDQIRIALDLRKNLFYFGTTDPD